MYNRIIHIIKLNDYQYFFVKIIIFLGIVVILDYGLGFILKQLYFGQTSGFQYRTTYSMEKTKAELLILGSSRANHHYHPEKFEKRLNLTYYNAGRDGTSILYDYAVLQGVLKRYTPRIIILDFNIRQFEKKQESYDRLSFLLPYYKTHKEIRHIVDLKGPNEKLKMISAIYPYNSSIFRIIAGNSEFNKKRTRDINGYVPLTKIMSSHKPPTNETLNYDIDSLKIAFYESFIMDCINANIKLYILCSPSSFRIDFNDPSIKLGSEIAEKFNIPFIDFSNTPVFFYNYSVFADMYHLNDEGAKLYSDLVIDSVFIRGAEND